jgi:hypothetical protein
VDGRSPVQRRPAAGRGGCVSSQSCPAPFSFSVTLLNGDGGGLRNIAHIRLP